MQISSFCKKLNSVSLFKLNFTLTVFDVKTVEVKLASYCGSCEINEPELIVTWFKWLPLVGGDHVGSRLVDAIFDF